MKKLIILTNNFPPHTNTASQRPWAWAKYMKEFGIQPIVIAKGSNEDVSDKIVVEENEDYTVYRVQTDKTLELQYSQAKSIFTLALRKWSSFINVFFHASYLFGPYKDLYDVAKSVIESTKGEKILICTVKPFGLLRLGFDLNRSTGIDWIADYRDDWTTTELPVSGMLKKIMYRTLYQYQEIKWVNTAKMVVSVSDHYVTKIKNLINDSSKLGLVVENGFFEEEHTSVLQSANKYKNISFVYVGSLYRTQDIDQLLEALLEATLLIDAKSQIDFIFLGTAFTKARRDILEASYRSDKLNFVFYDRLPKMEALDIQSRCHFAVICPHTNLKGIPSSKLYEFIGARMQVIYFPNDNDIIDRNLTSCGLGISAQSKKELVNKLSERLNNYKFGEIAGNDNCELFSRRASTKKLAEGIQQMSVVYHS